jgi:hypothetical protein
LNGHQLHDNKYFAAPASAMFAELAARNYTIRLKDNYGHENGKL